jgi:hypothetical protein
MRSDISRTVSGGLSLREREKYNGDGEDGSSFAGERGGDANECSGLDLGRSLWIVSPGGILGLGSMVSWPGPKVKAAPAGTVSSAGAGGRCGSKEAARRFPMDEVLLAVLLGRVLRLLPAEPAGFVEHRLRGLMAEFSAERLELAVGLVEAFKARGGKVRGIELVISHLRRWITMGASVEWIRGEIGREEAKRKPAAVPVEKPKPAEPGMATREELAAAEEVYKSLPARVLNALKSWREQNRAALAALDTGAGGRYENAERVACLDDCNDCGLDRGAAGAQGGAVD